MSEAKPAAKGGKKKLILLLVPLLLAGGGAGAWFSGLLPSLLHKHESKHDEEKTAERAPPVFMDLPDIVANLNGGPRRTTFVKLKAKLELARAEDKEPLTAAMPRVLDLFQGYLREMRPEELRGTASTYRLREELTARTNLAAPPARVVAVLFTEMLVQ